MVNVNRRQTQPFGTGMNMQVAFCNAMAVDIVPGTRYISISGQLAFDENGKLVGEGDFLLQSRTCLDNIRKILEGFGASMSDIVDVKIYVKEMRDLEALHELRLQYFKDPLPTSTLVQITSFVNKNALIEISAVAIATS